MSLHSSTAHWPRSQMSARSPDRTCFRHAHALQPFRSSLKEKTPWSYVAGIMKEPFCTDYNDKKPHIKPFKILANSSPIKLTVMLHFQQFAINFFLFLVQGFFHYHSIQEICIFCIVQKNNISI